MKKPKQRKVIQIAASAWGWGTDNNADGCERLCALCDDGTVWEQVFHKNVWQWRAVPPIPQGKTVIGG